MVYKKNNGRVQIVPLEGTIFSQITNLIVHFEQLHRKSRVLLWSSSISIQHWPFNLEGIHLIKNQILVQTHKSNSGLQIQFDTAV